MHKAGIIGASGYTGYELIKILSRHPKVELAVLNSESFAGKKVKDAYPDFEGDLLFTNYSIGEINAMGLEIVFLAVPHGVATDIVPQLKCKAIDLSADYRFRDPSEYERIYKVQHRDKGNKAVYGLPELFREEIKTASLVANPGCYATGMILSAYPLQKLAKYAVFDCKSGWSGAGKSSPYAKDPSISKDNLIAYNLVNHRHRFEVQQFISIPMSFTPHVIDTFQGMMITGHFLLNDKADAAEIKGRFRELYKGAPFTEIVDGIPDIHSVQKTNNLRIGGFEIDANNQLVVVTVLDNLLKGASGQAVQNMNLMLGFGEKEGLA